MQLIVKPKQTYFFRRLDSKCTYMQNANFRKLEANLSTVSFARAQKIGNCYFSPERLVFNKNSMHRAHTKIKGKILEITWFENPSLKNCSGQRITWVFKRLKTYKNKRDISLAKSLLFGTL